MHTHIKLSGSSMRPLIVAPPGAYVSISTWAESVCLGRHADLYLASYNDWLLLLLEFCVLVTSKSCENGYELVTSAHSSCLYSAAPMGNQAS